MIVRNIWSSSTWVVLVFLLATFSRVAGQIVVDAYTHPAVFEYEEIASNLLAGRGYTYFPPDSGIYVASQSSPLYIVLTALVYVVTNHSQPAMLLLQALLGGLTALVVVYIGSRVFSRSAGIAGGLLVAIDPALIAYAAQLHSLTIDALANVCLLAASIALPARPGLARAAAAGAVFGISALTRATALLLLPVHLVWLRSNRAVSLAAAAVMLLAAIVVYSPWPIRNSLILGELTLGSSETSEWLWRGNNPNADGNSLTSAGKRMIEVAPVAFREEVMNATEAQRMRIYQDAALSYMRSDPAGTVGLYVTKLKIFWLGSDDTGALYPPVWVLAYNIWYLVVLVLATIGAWISRRTPGQRSVVLLILITLFVISATQAVFYVEGRHRIAIEPLLLILAGTGATRVFERYATNRLKFTAAFARTRPERARIPAPGRPPAAP